MGFCLIFLIGIHHKVIFCHPNLYTSPESGKIPDFRNLPISTPQLLPVSGHLSKLPRSFLSEKGTDELFFSIAYVVWSSLDGISRMQPQPITFLHINYNLSQCLVKAILLINLKNKSLKGLQKQQCIVNRRNIRKRLFIHDSSCHVSYCWAMLL